MSEYHNPVLLKESIDALIEDKSGTYVDVTYGGGGHSSEILSRLNQDGKLIAFDQDSDAQVNLIEDDRFEFIPQNFKYVKNFLKLKKCIPIDGLLADLGVSSHQFNEGRRGFSLRFDGPLDMRMSSSDTITAAHIIKTYPLQELTNILRFYGEVKSAYRIAQEIVQAREIQSIQTTLQLVDLVKSVVGERFYKKESVKVFQALRIEVNKELEVLKELLRQAVELLKPGGRLVIISYHSLEDRLVKNYFRSGNFEGKMEKDFYGNIVRPFNPMKNKAIVPSDEEIEVNPRSRSAKLRMAERRLEHG